MIDQALDVPAASAAAAREHANELERERALAERSGAGSPTAGGSDRGLDEWRWLYFVAVVTEVESLRAELDAALNGE